MRLTELNPIWLTPDLFIFRNPTGGDRYLSCKRTLMKSGEQHLLFREKFPDLVIVATREDFPWSFVGNDFETMTVTPSIDASPSGNWHGYITNGEVI